MPILATLPNPNLFSSPPPNPKINDPLPQKSLPPPIPIPKYPPRPLKSPQNPPFNPALKSFHRRTKYHKPVSDGLISSEPDGRSVVLGESGVSYLLPGAPFEFHFSYSETPKVKPIAIREPAYLPFAPPSMPRPWTGKAPLKKSKKKIPLLGTSKPVPPGLNGVKVVEVGRPLQIGKYQQEGKKRGKILGAPLTKNEIRELVKPHLSCNRQVNLGRDGLTHNMLELVHTHWKRQKVCKVRCRGVPTVDMANVCRHLEEKTGGKIIQRVGGVIYLFRGRNYDHRTRPQYPIMLWKPATPVYPKLIQEAPEGLTKSEAYELREKGQKLLPICKLAKNGIYINLVKDVREAFEGSHLVKVNCQGMHASDYKKIGAKLKELVPCVLLCFDQEQILMWRGRDWKSMYPESCSLASNNHLADGAVSSKLVGSEIAASPPDDLAQRVNSGQLSHLHARPVSETPISSPKMLSLWNCAIETNKALLLDEISLGPDALLERVEEFEGLSQATEHSYPALLLPSGVDANMLATEYKDDSEGESEGESNEEYEDDINDDDLYDELDSPVPLGSLPLDSLARRLDLE